MGRSELDLMEAGRVNEFFRNRNLRKGAVLLLAARNRLRIRGREDAAQNRRMTENVCRGLGKSPSARLVFFSTVDVYGSRPLLPVTETNSATPADPYAESKWEAEEFLRREYPEDRLLILRLPGVFGVPGDPDSAVARIVAKIRHGQSPSLTSGGQVLRDYLWVGDLLRSVRHFLATSLHGTWNLVSGESRSMLSIAEACARGLGSPLPILTDPRRDPRDYDLTFDLSRLRPHLPATWPTPFEAALSRFLSLSHASP